MRLTDTMQIFRRIIGVIARIDKTGWVEVEDIAQDMDMNIADLRLWLLLMETTGILYCSFENNYRVFDVVKLKLPAIDCYGFNIESLKEY